MSQVVGRRARRPPRVPAEPLRGRRLITAVLAQPFFALLLSE